MKKRVMRAAIALALSYGAAAGAEEHLARFDGGIGVIPVSSGQGAAAATISASTPTPACSPR
jgi:hypothetical protein